VQCIDNGTLILCLQALERAIEYNEFLSQSETVDGDDYEEINYRYEIALNSLAKKYVQEREKDASLPVIEKVIKYPVVLP